MCHGKRKQKDFEKCFAFTGYLILTFQNKKKAEFMHDIPYKCFLNAAGL